MSQNRESCDCRRIPTAADIPSGEWYMHTDLLEKPGDFFWTYAGGSPAAIVIRIPGNEGGSVAPIPVVLGHGQSPWAWDRNLDKPTLTPSIWRNNGHRNDWHGFLSAGRLVSQ